MTVLEIDVEARDADGNIASDSAAVMVQPAAAAERPDPARAATMGMKMAANTVTISGFQNESLTNHHTRDNAYTPPRVTQVAKSATVAKFTGAFR